MSRLSLWVEAHRPDTLEGYVFKNKKIEQKVREWIANPDNKQIPIPHLLLVGTAGTGKTSLARILVKELHVNPVDVMEINASRENNVDVVRRKITNFCSTWANGAYKVIILDEFDGFSQQAQRILRGEMEKYSASVRFIATGNYANKILPAIHSRFQTFHFDALDMEAYIERLIEVLTKEAINFDVDDIMPFVNQSYPDLRKGINLLEQHVHNHILDQLDENDGSLTLDYMNDVAALFQEKKYTEARKLICSQAQVEDYEGIYQFLYKNSDMFGESEHIQSRAIIYIAQGLRDHGLSADPEINLAATLCRLSSLKE